jgi:hypothetical protein
MKESLKRRQHQIEHLPQVYPYPSINNKKKKTIILIFIEK